MNFALLTVSYSGLWHDGDALTLDEQIRAASDLGFDAVSIETKRPVASPLDFDAADRQRIKRLADDEGIDLCALESVSDFASPIAEERENNLAMMREILRFADDLGIDLVKVFAAWPGVDDESDATGVYADFDVTPHWEQRWPEDARRWNRAVSGIREVADWAADRGITLALQNHAPVLSPGYEDVVEMVADIDRENVEICLDAPLFFERQSDEYVREAVRACGDDLAITHYGAWNFSEKDGEIVQEVSPQFGEQINYEAFVDELEAIGYDGHLVSEYCLPAMAGHELQGRDAIDRGLEISLDYMQDLVTRSEAPLEAE
ncbi:sugar phosphate isomerase/epimerase [Halobacteria archaeon AArc-dxtr1]|nr:sugar phosphate isomerase/epimerase [Halobacteria archaeon AArc-dxtr1]